MKNKLILFIVAIIHLISAFNVYAGDPLLARNYIDMAAQFLSKPSENACQIIGLYRMAMAEHTGGAQGHPAFRSVEAAAKKLEQELKQKNEEELNRLRGQIEDFKGGLACKDKTLKESEDRINRLSAERENIFKEREDMRNSYKTLQDKANELNKTKEELVGSLKSSQEKLEKTAKEKTSIQQEKTKLEEDIAKVRAALEEQLKAAEQAKSDQAKSFEAEQEELKTELTNINKKLSEAQGNAEAVESAKAALEEQLKAANKAKADQAKSFEAELEELKTELEKINAKLSEAQGNAEAVESAKAALEEQLKAANKAKADQAKSFEAEQSKLIAELELLKNEHTEKLQELNDKINELNNKLDTSANENECLRNELAKANEKLKLLGTENLELVSRVQELDRALAQNQEMLKKAECERDNALLQLERLQNEFERQAEEMAKARDLAKRLAEEHIAKTSKTEQEMLNSINAKINAMEVLPKRLEECKSFMEKQQARIRELTKERDDLTAKQQELKNSLIELKSSNQQLTQAEEAQVSELKLQISKLNKEIKSGNSEILNLSATINELRNEIQSRNYNLELTRTKHNLFVKELSSHVSLLESTLSIPAAPHVVETNNAVKNPVKNEKIEDDENNNKPVCNDATPAQKITNNTAPTMVPKNFDRSSKSLDVFSTPSKNDSQIYGDSGNSSSTDYFEEEDDTNENSTVPIGPTPVDIDDERPINVKSGSPLRKTASLAQILISLNPDGQRQVTPPPSPRRDLNSSPSRSRSMSQYSPNNPATILIGRIRAIHEKITEDKNEVDKITEENASYEELFQAIETLDIYINDGRFFDIIKHIENTGNYDINSIKTAIPSVCLLKSVDSNKDDNLSSLLEKLKGVNKPHQSYLSTRSLIYSVLSHLDSIHIYCIGLITKYQNHTKLISPIERVYADLTPRYRSALIKAIDFENRYIIEKLKNILDKSKISKMVSHFNYTNDVDISMDFCKLVECSAVVGVRVTTLLTEYGILPAINDIETMLNTDGICIWTDRAVLLQNALKYINLIISILDSVSSHYRDACVKEFSDKFSNAADKIQKMINCEVPLRSNGWFSKDTRPIWDI